MRESCTYGSVRGASSNGGPYRDRFPIWSSLPRSGLVQYMFCDSIVFATQSLIPSVEEVSPNVGDGRDQAAAA
jgi:hypothetical protein